MRDCNCSREAWAGMEHAFDCPARFDETNRKLAQFGGDNMAIPNYKIELRAGGIHAGFYFREGVDPRNYFGRYFFPENYGGHRILERQKISGWAHKIRQKDIRWLNK